MASALSRRVRVLHVLDSHDLGGAQRVVLNLALHRDRDRFDVTVAAMHGPGVFTPRFAEAGAEVRCLSPSKYLPLYVPRLAGLLRRCDIAHFHLFGSVWFGQLIGSLAGPRLRYTHDHCNDAFRTESRLVTAIDAAIARLATRILAVSQSTRDYLVGREGVPPEKVQVFPNSVDVAEFRPANEDARKDARRRLGVPPDAVVIGGAGRLVPQKNFPVFLDVFASLGRILPADSWARCHALLAGEGPDAAALRDRARALGVEERVHWLGYREGMREIYQALDVLFLPSLYEGLPMVLLEAMAMGLPVVASRLDGIREILDEPREGLLAEPKDAGAFRDHLSALILDPARARRLGAEARRKAEDRFSAAAVTRRLESLYTQDMKSLLPARAV